MGRVAANGHEPHEWYQWYERYQTGTKRHQPHEWNQRDERYQKGTKWAPTSTRRAILVLGARAGKYRSWRGCRCRAGSSFWSVQGRIGGFRGCPFPQTRRRVLFLSCQTVRCKLFCCKVFAEFRFPWMRCRSREQIRYFAQWIWRYRRHIWSLPSRRQRREWLCSRVPIQRLCVHFHIFVDVFCVGALIRIFFEKFLNF